mgnify:CR=1 FL=1
MRRILQGGNRALTSGENIWKRERKTRTIFLEDGLLWKESKKLRELHVRVVETTEQERQIMTEFHKSDWDGNRGTWSMFLKILIEILVEGDVPGYR